jgi:hypothetical protein
MPFEEDTVHLGMDKMEHTTDGNRPLNLNKMMVSC